MHVLIQNELRQFLDDLERLKKFLENQITDKTKKDEERRVRDKDRAAQIKKEEEQMKIE